MCDVCARLFVASALSFIHSTRISHAVCACVEMKIRVHLRVYMFVCVRLCPWSVLFRSVRIVRVVNVCVVLWLCSVCAMFTQVQDKETAVFVWPVLL